MYGSYMNLFVLQCCNINDLMFFTILGPQIKQCYDFKVATNIAMGSIILAFFNSFVAVSNKTSRCHQSFPKMECKMLSSCMMLGSLIPNLLTALVPTYCRGTIIVIASWSVCIPALHLQMVRNRRVNQGLGDLLQQRFSTFDGGRGCISEKALKSRSELTGSGGRASEADSYVFHVFRIPSTIPCW